MCPGGSGESSRCPARGRGDSCRAGAVGSCSAGSGGEASAPLTDVAPAAPGLPGLATAGWAVAPEAAVPLASGTEAPTPLAATRRCVSEGSAAGPGAIRDCSGGGAAAAPGFPAASAAKQHRMRLNNLFDTPTYKDGAHVSRHLVGAAGCPPQREAIRKQPMTVTDRATGYAIAV